MDRCAEHPGLAVDKGVQHISCAVDRRVIHHQDLVKSGVQNIADIQYAKHYYNRAYAGQGNMPDTSQASRSVHSGQVHYRSPAKFLPGLQDHHGGLKPLIAAQKEYWLYPEYPQKLIENTGGREHIRKYPSNNDPG